MREILHEDAKEGKGKNAEKSTSMSIFQLEVLLRKTSAKAIETAASMPQEK